MTASFRNSAIGAFVALLLSVGVGLNVLWRTLDDLVVRTIRLRAEQTNTERKKLGWDFWTVEIENLSSELKDELAGIQQRNEALKQREAQITREERELAQARSDLEAMQKQISDRVVEISTDERSNLKKLAQTYSILQPAAAVAIIRELDDNTAVKILSLMKPDEVAPIFDQMSKSAGADGTLARRAALLSDKLRLLKSTSAPATP